MPIYLASSPWLVATASCFYMSIAMALLLLNWPWYLSFCIFAILAMDYRRVIYLHGLRTHHDSVSLLVQDCAKWQYQLFSGQRLRAKLLKKRSYSSRIVLILYLKTLTQGRYVVIPRDALSQRNYRFLAMQIRG